MAEGRGEWLLKKINLKKLYIHQLPRDYTGLVGKNSEQNFLIQNQEQREKNQNT